MAAWSLGRNHQAFACGSSARAATILSAGKSVPTVSSPLQINDRPGRSVRLRWVAEVTVTSS
jgi:hypothetical protein